MKATRLKLAFLFVLMFGLLYSCQKDEVEETVPTQLEEDLQVTMPNNPDPAMLGDLPTATVDHFNYAPYEQVVTMRNGEATLTRELLEATLKPGESITETKTAYIPGAPASGDVMFAIDVTGSMWEELNNTKSNSCAIMDGIRALISDTRFGLMSHMDYVGYFSGCEYGDTYGDDYYGDYPYRLDQALTETCTDVTDAINALSLGSGGDFPESYSRVFYETYSDPAVAWRPSAKKIVIAELDAIPHDCDYDAIIGKIGTTGPDPGRNGIYEGGADDIEIMDALDGMKANGITLIVIYSGEAANFDLWSAYTNQTDGIAVQIDEDATIPGGLDIVELIVNLITEEVTVLDELNLEVVTPGFSGWLTSVIPDFTTPVDLSSPWTGHFDATFTVPLGTPDGVYEFQVALVGDGTEFAYQTVRITVESEIEVPFDVHPTSCPNPINTKGGGVIPAAILGTADFDVDDIDPATIRVEGIAPIRWAYEDVATPYFPFVNKPLDPYACNEYNGDSYKDLTLKLDKKLLVATFGPLDRGDVLILHLTGQLYDGTDIVGEDVILIAQ